MGFPTLAGLDHVMIVVRDLDQAAANWRRLGFTLSPMGVHSAHLGSANYTIMLADDYLELLGVIAETPNNASVRAALQKREGIHRAAFKTTDAAKGASALKARGLEPNGPIEFSRPVELPNGGKSEARFRVFRWPETERPGDLGIFACEHLTPNAVWIPELQHHANTARRIVRIEIVSLSPRKHADHMAQLIDAAPSEEADGAWRVPSGGGRADFVFLDRQLLLQRHPAAAAGDLPEEGPVAIILAAADLEAAHRSVGARGVAGSNQVDVPLKNASGALLSFVAEK